MSRTKGARDRKPRKMRPTIIQGHQTATVRIYAPEGVVMWFARLTAQQRGRVIANARSGFTA